MYQKYTNSWHPCLLVAETNNNKQQIIINKGTDSVVGKVLRNSQTNRLYSWYPCLLLSETNNNKQGYRFCSGKVCTRKYVPQVGTLVY